MHSFETRLIRPDMAGTWTYLEVPFDVEHVFGTKARIPVQGTVDGCPFRSSLMPQGDGRFILVINQTIRERIGKANGDTVSVTLDRDDAPREAEVPDDLALALDNDPEAGDQFREFSYSKQKEYVDWILSAKKAETRQSRIEKALIKIRNKERLKG